MSAWVNKMGVSNVSCCRSDILSKNRDSNPNSITLRVNHAQDNDFGFGASNVGGTGSISRVTDNRWYHVVGTISDGFVRIYVNGVLESTSYYINWNIGSNNSPLLIGKQQGDGSQTFFYLWNGKIDDIGMWNRALSQQEINALYQACRIIIQPSNQTTGTNRNVQFSVVSSEPNSTYRWQSNSGCVS